MWSMVMVMFGYKHVEILLEIVAEILVVLLIYCWFKYWVELGFKTASSVHWLMGCFDQFVIDALEHFKHLRGSILC